MTENRRIVLNIAATYSRSLFSLICAVFTSRWVLQALGEVDCGLNGVVGSLMAMLAFLNCVMSGGIGRFYALSLGNAKTAVDKGAALEECRRWFSLALGIHLLMALLFVVVFYPVGMWAIENWLTVPPARMDDCIEVFRLSCFACVIGMVTLPFSAMYTAKQEIAEVTFFSVAVTVFLVVLSYYMVTHPGDWFVPFARWTCASASIPCVVYAVHGFIRFPECRARWRYMVDGTRIRQLLVFVGWGVVGPLSVLLRVQGGMILINRFFGPAVNASWALSRTVCDKSNTLSESIKGAMVPAVVQAAGAGNDARMHSLVFRMCKFALAATLLVALPLALELRFVLDTWLGVPPPCMYGLALFMIIDYIAMVATSGYDTAVYAKGRLALYQCVAGAFSFATLPAMYIAYRLGGGVYAVAGTATVMLTSYSVIRVVIAARLVGMSFATWVKRMILPLALVSAAVLASGGLVVYALPQGWVRLFVTVSAMCPLYMAFVWKFVFDDDERHAVKAKILRLTGSVRDGGILS